MTLRSVLATLSLAAFALAAPARAGPVPQAVATIGMIGDVAAQVAGDCVRVATLMGPGTDPHLYRARPADVRLLERADLILYLGLGLEGQLAQVLERLAERRPVLGLGDAFPPGLLRDEDGSPDPHLWMQPGLWAQAVPPLAEALAGIAPACAEDIAARAETVVSALGALDAWAAASLATIPPERRVLVTAHDAFGYLGRAYGLEVEAIQGISTEAEASVADIAAVASLVAERQVPVVFVESTVNPRTVEAVVAAAKDRGHAVMIGPELLADALGEAGTPAGSYPGMIVHNVTAIAVALGGTPLPVPEELAAWIARGGLDN